MSGYSLWISDMHIIYEVNSPNNSTCPAVAYFILAILTYSSVGRTFLSTQFMLGEIYQSIAEGLDVRVL